MTGNPADIWGHCESCRRWFACPTWFDQEAPHPVCPVCLSEPSRIVNRARGREPVDG